MQRIEHLKAYIESERTSCDGLTWAAQIERACGGDIHRALTLARRDFYTLYISMANPEKSFAETPECRTPQELPRLERCHRYSPRSAGIAQCISCTYLCSGATWES